METGMIVEDADEAEAEKQNDNEMVIIRMGSDANRV